MSASDETHHKELTNAQTNQARLRDRLATSDVRLSASLPRIQPVAVQCQPVPQSTAWFMEKRARLTPTRAQRVIGITNAGDQGLIALAACPVYVREVSQ